MDNGSVPVTYVRLSLLQFATEFLSGTATGLRSDAIRLLRDEIGTTASILILDWSGISHASDQSLELLQGLVNPTACTVNIAVESEITAKLRTANLKDKTIGSIRELDNLSTEFPFVSTDEGRTPSGISRTVAGYNECVTIQQKRLTEDVADAFESLCGSQESLANEVQRIEQEVFDSRVGACFVRKEQYLRSTPLWANGYFDAQELIGDPSIFPWIAFRMARIVGRIQQAVARGKDDVFPKPRLLACTQNGATLSMAVTHMLKRDVVSGDRIGPLGVDIIDRFGPSEMFIEEYCSDELSTPSFYIFVGDFVIAGTELKIAEVHSYHRHTVLRHAVVIGSVLDWHHDNRGTGPARQLLNRIYLHPIVNVAEVKDPNGKLISPNYRFPKGAK